MVKVFISVPMRNRKKEDIEYSIRKMKKIARAYLSDIENEEIEFVNTLVKDESPKGADKSVWCLGASIQILSECDYLICPEITYHNMPGCAIEKDVFTTYKKGSNIITVPNQYLYSEAEKAVDAEDGEMAAPDII